MAVVDSSRKVMWCEALRSGRYVQGQGLLKDKVAGQVQYCCMGVLAELDEALIFDETYWPDPKDPVGNWMVIKPGEYEGSVSYYLPDADRQVAGELAALNDGGMSFPDIASWIEANL